MLRPSSLPVLDQCSCFDGRGTDFAIEGTTRHKVLAEYYKARALLPSHIVENKELNDILSNADDEESMEGIKWACNYLLCHTEPKLTKIEIPCIATLPDFSDLKGTADYIYGNHLFDFKWRIRNYDAQMACYALSIIQDTGCEIVNVTLLFGAVRQVATYTLNQQECERKISKVVEKYNYHFRQPESCDYCDWCRWQRECPALVAMAAKVVNGYADALELTSWHPSAISNPDEMAVALRASKVLDGWCKSVTFHALEMVQKLGLSIPGWTLKDTAGRSWIDDIQSAFQALGLPQEEFFKACDLRLNPSKKYPEKITITGIYSEFNKIPLATAKREVKQRLQFITQQGKSGVKLVEEKTDNDNNEDNE
jgi:hypothetical protein